MADTLYKLTHTGAQIDTAIDTVNMALTGGSASGNPVTIENMLKNSIVSLKVNGLTTQAGSGTPSPTNVRAISGVAASATVGGTAYSVSTGALYTGDYADLVSGAVHRAMYLVTLTGTETYTASSSNVYVRPTASTLYPTRDSGTLNSNLCSHYPVGTSIGAVYMGTNGVIYFGSSLFAASADGAAAAKSYAAAQYAAGTPIQYLYQLAAATDTTVTGNTINNAAGDVTISAANTVDVTISGAASAADLTTETNKRITADTGVRGLTATVEATSTASQAYAIGAYFVYNGLLYKCTVAIAQGGTITPGTNCTATTAGTELYKLNQNLEWKHGSAIIGGTVSLPDEWTEALCCFHKNDFSSGTLQVHLMRSLTAAVEGREFDGGFYINGTNYGGARCFATQSTVSFTLFYINGEDASQNSTMDVYYRC